MYWSSKINKPFFDSFPKLKPMLSTLNTYTFKLLKFLVPLLRHQISKDFTLKVNFEFVKIICEKDADLFMASLDINSPFMKSSIFV